MFIYSECFEMLLVEYKGKSYNIGVVYYITANRIWVTDIIVQEV